MKKAELWKDILNEEELEELEDELNDSLEMFNLDNDMVLLFSNHEAKRNSDISFTLEKGDIVVEGLYSKDTGKLFDFDIDSITDLELKAFIKNDLSNVLIEKINEILEE